MSALTCNLDIPAATLSAGTARTIAQLVAAANHRVRLLALELAGDGVAGTDAPIRLRILRQTSAGTMTTATPTKVPNLGSETLQTGAAVLATAEPTAGDVIFETRFHPQANYRLPFQLGQEYVMVGGERLGIECLSPNGCSVNGYLRYEE